MRNFRIRLHGRLRGVTTAKLCAPCHKTTSSVLLCISVLCGRAVARSMQFALWLPTTTLLLAACVRFGVRNAIACNTNERTALRSMRAGILWFSLLDKNDGRTHITHTHTLTKHCTERTNTNSPNAPGIPGVSSQSHTRARSHISFA